MVFERFRCHGHYGGTVGFLDQALTGSQGRIHGINGCYCLEELSWLVRSLEQDISTNRGFMGELENDRVSRCDGCCGWTGL